MRRSLKVAFCGMFSALSTVIMLMAGVIPIASIALPAIAGCVFIPITAEIGQKWSYVSYAVVSVLSFFLTADRTAMLIFVLFFGYYPILFATFSKIKSSILKVISKLALFNIAAILDYFIVSYIFLIPFETIEFLGEYTPIVILLVANVVFLMYDYSLKGVIDLYFFKFQKYVKRMFSR